MKRMCLAVFAVCALSLAMSRDSIAEPDAGAKVVIPPWPDPEKTPKLADEVFPEEKSPKPTIDEWKAAPRLRPTSMPRDIKNCDFKHVREWVRVHCERKTAVVRFLAGPSEGVAVYVARGPKVAQTAAEFESIGRLGEIVFPARRGDRRLFEWIDLGFDDWGGFGMNSAFFVEETFSPGATHPDVVVIPR